VSRVGARPIFVDIDPVTFNISPAAIANFLEQRCEKNTQGQWIDAGGRIVRAIIPVHLFGLCCAMDAINAIAERYRLIVIEDAAQAIGAEYPGKNGARQAGTMSLVGSFSFYPSKNLGAAGDAGMIVCDDDDLAQRLRIFRQHGMEPRYFHHVIGGNFRIDAIQAAILNIKLPHLNGWSAARRITLPAEPYLEIGLMNHHIYHQYVIRAPRRDALQKHLSAQGIGSAIYYPLGLHEQKCFAALGYQAGDLPETERAAQETLALPIYPELTPDMQRIVVDAIGEFFAA
jgi:dTDP-4-amino-4,6-dideoxygalactose transaminase